jgi:hypothetical protein
MKFKNKKKRLNIQKKIMIIKVKGRDLLINGRVKKKKRQSWN